ncbi:MAG: hypothetical protein K0B15_17255 [Lentimicrobium sp.]|nr:hypothetical protein [Lentimicrobium sp.]
MTCPLLDLSLLSDEKAKAALKNSELLQRFREDETLPERKKPVLLEIIGAYIGCLKFGHFR